MNLSMKSSRLTAITSTNNSSGESSPENTNYLRVSALFGNRFLQKIINRRIGFYLSNQGHCFFSVNNLQKTNSWQTSMKSTITTMYLGTLVEHIQGSRKAHPPIKKITESEKYPSSYL